MELFKIKVDIREEDIIALFKYHQKLKRVRTTLIYIGLIVLFSFFFVSAKIELMYSILTAFVLTAAFALLNPRLGRIRYLKQFEANKNFKEPLEYHIYPDRYRVKASSSESEVLWATRYDIRQDGDYIFIFHTREMTSMLPKRCMTADELTFFDELIEKFGKAGTSEKRDD